MDIFDVARHLTESGFEITLIHTCSIDKTTFDIEMKLLNVDKLGCNVN